VKGYERCRRAELKRRLRLLRKIQKAKALHRIDEILSLPSWGKRFGRTARLRVGA
jgi:hypothetical protein